MVNLKTYTVFEGPPPALGTPLWGENFRANTATDGLPGTGLLYSRPACKYIAMLASVPHCRYIEVIPQVTDTTVSLGVRFSCLFRGICSDLKHRWWVGSPLVQITVEHPVCFCRKDVEVRGARLGQCSICHDHMLAGWTILFPHFG
ncbi:hypothetical protein GCM10027271_13060 [Saccharopolyspora gloriosae]